MIVSFETPELRDRCANREQAEMFVGQEYVEALFAILSDAEAVESAAEFIELYAPNVATTTENISVRMGTEYRMTLVPIGVGIVRSDVANPDWHTVMRLKIVELTRC